MTSAILRPKRALAALRRIVDRKPVGPRQREADLRMREREPPHRLRHGVRLGAVGAQELQPRRHREEEVAQPRSACPAARLAGRASPTRPPSTSIAQACSSLAWRDSIESRATAPIDASASPRKPSVAIAARSSPGSFDVQWRATASGEVGGRHARAVVGDADQALAAAGGHDLDPPRAGVERVLDKLLHDARRALHHLAGGDPVDDMIGETANRHGARPRSRNANPSGVLAQNDGEERPLSRAPGKSFCQNGRLACRCPCIPPAPCPRARDRRAADRSGIGARCG